ncbi:hypothetical protein LTR86_005789 [Recurvomyces mirabilis]|nr:hypothetical protein LTR86_005789 [Recurvomyces mirabilis]
MAAEGQSIDQMRKEVRKLSGFENVRPGVVNLLYQMYMNKKVKLTGLAKAQALAKEIEAKLWSFVAESHLFNDDPGAADDSGFKALEGVMGLVKQRFETRDTEKYNRNAGPPVSLPTPTVVQISTTADVEHMTRAIVEARQTSADVPTLYLDCEGEDLGRQGKISLMQMFMPSNSTVYIIYAHHLGEDLWQLSNGHPTLPTLKHILESAGIKKVFWGAIGDSEALFFHHRIRLDPTSVVDLQLLDLASYQKAGDRKNVKTMSLAVEKYLNLPTADKQKWVAIKIDGKRMMNEGMNYGAVVAWEVEMARSTFDLFYGDEDVKHVAGEKFATLEAKGCPDPQKVKIWQELPLHPRALEYAVGDVLLLPLLHNHYAQSKRLTHPRLMAVEEATRARISASHDPMAENPKSRGPEGWADKAWCEEATKTTETADSHEATEGQIVSV